MNRHLAFALALAVFGSLVRAQSEDAAGIIDLRRVHGEAVNYYPPLRIPLQRYPAETLAAKPDCRAAEPFHGSLTMGNGSDRTIAVLLDEDLPAKYGRLWVDANNDEDLTNDPPVEWKRQDNGNWHGRAVVRVSYETEGGGEHEVEYQVRFWRFEDRFPDVLFYTRDSYVEGKVRIGERSWRLCLLDGNGDGLFDDREHGALVVDRNGDGKLERDMSSAEHFACDEPFELGGRGWRVESIAPDGLTARIVEVPGPPPEKAFLEAGHPAPAFEAVDLEGRPVSLQDFAGRLLLLDFWATWCGPCMNEMPHVVEAYRQFHERGFEILGISLDQDLEKLRAYLAQETGVAWRQVCDGKGWKAELAQRWRVTGIPATFLIGPDGKIVARGLRGSALTAELTRRLGAPAGGGTGTAERPPEKVEPPRATTPEKKEPARPPAERTPDDATDYRGESHDAWMAKARTRLEEGRFEEALAAAYSAKLANPAYRTWQSCTPHPHPMTRFEEEALVRAARSGLTRKAEAPAGAFPMEIPVVSRAPDANGRMEEGEWDAALVLEAGIGGTRTTVRMLSDGATLFVACDAPEETTAGGYDQFRMYFHVNLCPAIRYECVFVGREDVFSNRCTTLRWQGEPAAGDPDRWKQHPINESPLFESARGGSQVLGHRQFEFALGLDEAGIHRGVPFSAHFEVESDPVSERGKFKRRVMIGEYASEQAPAWFVLR